MKMRSLLAAAALFSSVAIANAAEPVALTDAQMDGVTAGLAFSDAYANAYASGIFFAATYTYTDAWVNSGLFYSEAGAYSESHAAAF